jgi:hypothetical protein
MRRLSISELLSSLYSAGGKEKSTRLVLDFFFFMGELCFLTSFVAVLLFVHLTNLGQYSYTCGLVPTFIWAPTRYFIINIEKKIGV